MTSNAQSRQPVAPATRGGMPKWTPWAVLGVSVAVLVLLASVGPGRLLALLTTRPAPRAKTALSLTVVHSNDTWGFMSPCG